MTWTNNLNRANKGSQFDLSTVRVRLLNENGVERESVDCAPNGYFFLPAYEPDRYRLVVTGPAGWTFGLYLSYASFSYLTFVLCV